MSRTQTQIVIKGRDEASGVFQQTARRMNLELEGIKRRVFSLQGAFGALGVGLSAAAITRFVGTATKEFGELERVGMRIQKQLELTGADWTNWEQINTLARQIGRETLASAGEVRQAASLMLTSGNATRENFERSLRVAQDLAEVTGMQLPAAARYLSRATADVSGAMSMFRRYGIDMTDAQRDIIDSMVEAGEQTKAYDYLLSQLEGRIGGTAKEAAQGLAGSFDTLGESATQLRETIGERLAPSVENVVDKFTGWIDANEELIAQQVEQKIMAIASATGTAYDRISDIYGLWDRLPDDVKGAAGYGLIGAVLFGKKGFALGALISGLVEPVQNIGRALAEIEAGNLSLQEFSTMNAKELADHFKFLDGALKDVGQSSEVAKEQAFLMKLEYKDLIRVLQESDLGDDYFSDAQYRALVRRVMHLKESTEDGTSAWERSGHAARDWGKTVQAETEKAEGATEDYNEALKLVKDAWDELATTDEWEAQKELIAALEKLGPDDPLVKDYLEALDLIEQGTLNAHRAMAEGTGTDGWLRREMREVTEDQQKYFDDRDRLQKEATRAAEEAARKRTRAEERAAKESLRVWERGLDNLQDATSTTFRNMLDNGVSSFKDLGDSFVGIMKNALAEILATYAHTKIIRPLQLPGAHR